MASVIHINRRDHLNLFKFLNFVYLRAFKNTDILHEINTDIFYVSTLESSSMTFLKKKWINFRLVWLPIDYYL